MTTTVHFVKTCTSSVSGREYERVPCGSRPWGEHKTTTDPTKVTCGSCKRSPLWRESMEAEGHTVQSSADRPWRKIVRRESRYENHESFRGRSYSFRAVRVHTLYLECGHTQERRGYCDPPKHKVICKDCEAGQPAVPVEVEPGFEDKPPVVPVIAQAILDNEYEKARSRRAEKEAAHG